VLACSLVSDISSPTQPPAAIAWTSRIYRRRGSGRFVPGAWPLYTAFVLLPVWWLVGVSGFVMSVMGVLMIIALLFRRHLTTPKGFSLFLLFLLWCVFSASQVSDSRQLFSLSYRGSIYLASGALFLYILNHPHEELPTGSVVKAIAGFWLIVVVGGTVGMVGPTIQFTTPMQRVLPAKLVHDPFVHDLVSASTASGRAFAAYPIHRPKAPFPYTNLWGASYALGLPFAVLSLAYMKKKRNRDAMVLILAFSIIPLTFSLDRGAWLSATGGVIYATLRLARGRNAQLLKAVGLGVILLGVLLVATPLGTIIGTRLSHGYGDAHRAQLYTQSTNLVWKSPVFGYGAPVLVEGNLSAGTHGQLWTILVSQGIPGLLFFVGWLLWAMWKASRKLPSGHPGDPAVRFWCEVATFVAIIQMPYYDLLPWGLPIAMTAAALAFRETMYQRVSPVPAPRGPTGWTPTPQLTR
jgi:polysaccharide biosynthesis protein PslJ